MKKRTKEWKENMKKMKKNEKKMKKKNEKNRKKLKMKKKMKNWSVSPCYGVSLWWMEAWVTRPERPKGVKDEVKQARRAKSRPELPPARSRAPEGP